MYDTFEREALRDMANCDMKGGTLKSLFVELETARRQFPTNINLVQTLIEFADELKALMDQNGRDNIFGEPDNKGVMRVHCMSKAIQCAALAIRIFEEGDAAYRFGKAQTK